MRLGPGVRLHQRSLGAGESTSAVQSSPTQDLSTQKRNILGSRGVMGRQKKASLRSSIVY